LSNKKRTCTAEGCKTKVLIKHPFCRECFAKLPKEIKSGLVYTRQSFDGAEVMQAKNRAREFLKDLHERQEEKTMVSGKSELVDVMLEDRGQHENGKAHAFFQGDYLEDRHGNEREQWIWLPLSQIEIQHENNSVCTVTMPEWLALDKGLI